MPSRKTFEPHCPANDCSGGKAGRLHHVHEPEDVEMPPDVLARRRPLESIYKCSYCQFVWFQPSSSAVGFNADPAGFYENPRWPDGFKAASEDYRIREENTSEYWRARDDKNAKKRKAR